MPRDATRRDAWPSAWNENPVNQRVVVAVAAAAVAPLCKKPPICPMASAIQSRRIAGMKLKSSNHPKWRTLSAISHPRFSPWQPESSPTVWFEGGARDLFHLSSRLCFAEVKWVWVCRDYPTVSYTGSPFRVPHSQRHGLMAEKQVPI